MQHLNPEIHSKEVKFKYLGFLIKLIYNKKKSNIF